jgi:hypothetical protein
VTSRMPPKSTDLDRFQEELPHVGDPQHAAASRDGRLILEEQRQRLEFNFDPASP